MVAAKAAPTRVTEIAQHATGTVRVIEIEDSPVTLLCWEEPADPGSTTGGGGDGSLAHYAISLDGQSVARTTATHYRIGLGAIPFDPLAGVPRVPPALRAAPDQKLVVVQFVTQPLALFARRIEACGGVVRHVVARHAYLVELVEADARQRIAALPCVRWTGPYHPAYRIERGLAHQLLTPGAAASAVACNVQVLLAEQKRTVAGRLARLGATLLSADSGKLLVTARLDGSQLARVATWDEVLYIDRHAALEPDMDIVRAASGADSIETVAGYSGQGVRGEVFDIGFYLEHGDFASRPLIVHGGPVSQNAHGASTSGILFGDGSGNPQARGLLPDGQGIVADWSNIGHPGPPRYAHTAELLLPPYEAVFVSSSVGAPRTALYTTDSAEMDAMLFDLDIASCQAQGASGDPTSRPEAWAKNIISVGGINHYGTLDRSDDCWCGQASTGPAADGRIKPTLSHFHDQILTVDCCTPTSYNSQFGGTSAATPIVCGHLGLFFQMWADGLFGNPVDPAQSVFANRCHMTTAKAVLVNTAEQYDFSGTSHDKARMHQGWGLPDLARLYALRDQLFVVDETAVLEPFATARYDLEVPVGAPSFKVTMTYADPPGNPAVQTQHRVNDLDLRVTAPGGTVYAGNLGLLDSPWSVPGEVPDALNTVENVFVEGPEAGTWMVEVIAVEIVQDGHVETAALDADFALVAAPVATPTAGIGPETPGGSSGDAGGGVAHGEGSAAGDRDPGLELLVRSAEPGAAGGATRLAFRLAREMPVSLRIHDVTGHTVRTLVAGVLAAGPHEFVWHGRDDSGRALARGVYFAHLRAAGHGASVKILRAE
jgi:hypothetical protein